MEEINYFKFFIKSLISYLQGKLILKKDKFVALDVNGVGYKVFLSKKSILNLPELGQVLKVFCYLDVGEIKMDLYGFLDEKELEFFETLNDIRGIGPKAALEISSIGPLEKIKDKILKQDEKIFESIPGIGKKKAMAIVLELTGKINNLFKEKKSGGDEVEDALLGLGFSKQKIREVLPKVPKEIKDPQERIKQTLKLLGRT